MAKYIISQMQPPPSAPDMQEVQLQVASSLTDVRQVGLMLVQKSRTAFSNTSLEKKRFSNEQPQFSFMILVHLAQLHDHIAAEGACVGSLISTHRKEGRNQVNTVAAIFNDQNSIILVLLTSLLLQYAAFVQRLLDAVRNVIGTDVSADQPLMEAGLDSIGICRILSHLHEATELFHK